MKHWQMERALTEIKLNKYLSKTAGNDFALWSNTIFNIKLEKMLGTPQKIESGALFANVGFLRFRAKFI